MPCSFSTPLNEDQITEALDGQADTTVQGHLAGCVFCASRLGEARKVEQMLMNNLYHWDCPTPQQLGNYHMNLADPGEVKDIAQHVAYCLRCAAEIEELDAFLNAALPPPKSQPQRLKPQRPRNRLSDLVAHLLPRSHALALRGSDSGPLMAEAEGVTIFLELQRVPEGHVLVGQVVTEEPATWLQALVELRQAGTLLMTATLDDMGTFRCWSPEGQPVDIRITAPQGRRIVLRDVNLTL